MTKIQKKNLIFFMFGLYTILPQYFRLFNISSQIIVACVIIGLYFFFFFKNKINVLTLKYSMVFFVPYAIALIAHGEYVSIFRYFIELVMLLIIITQIVENKSDFYTFLDLILNFCVFEAIFGIIHFFTDFNIFSLLSNTTDINFIKSDFGAGTQYRLGFPRIEGSFSHAITFGIYLSIGEMICLYLYNNRKYKKYYIYYILLFFALILTFSRMPILIFLFTQFIYIIILNYKKALRIIFKIIIVISIIIVFISIVFPTFANKFVKVIDYMFSSVFSSEAVTGFSTYKEESAFTYRATMLLEVPSKVSNNFLFGLGPEGMKDFKFYVNKAPQTSIDNQYLFYYATYGIFGLFFTLSWFLQLLLIDKEKCIKKEKLRDFKTYRNFVIFIYAVNLFSVAMMEEYKFITVIIGICLSEILLRKGSYNDETSDI